MNFEISRNVETGRYIWRIFDETDRIRGMLGSTREYETAQECGQELDRCIGEMQAELERHAPN